LPALVPIGAQQVQHRAKERIDDFGIAETVGLQRRELVRELQCLCQPLLPRRGIGSE